MSLEQKDINHTHYDSLLLSNFSLLLLITWKKEESFKFAYSEHISRKGFPIACAQLLEHTAKLLWSIFIPFPRRAHL